MAHQAHSIPWNSLASNLKFCSQYRRANGRTNLFFCNKAQQGKEIMYFAKGFTRTLTSVAQTERAKYPSAPACPSHEEIVISDEAAARIESTVRRYRSTNDRLSGRRTCLPGCEPADTNFCGCPLSLEERRMSLWLLELDCRCPGCCCYTHIHSDTGELAKTLLLHGQMESLLRICANPAVDLVARWSFPWDCGAEFGWAELMRCALMSYICLNIIFCKPEIWDQKSKQEWLGKLRGDARIEDIAELDYRRMSSYQKLLSRSTGFRRYDVHLFPHREFFGVGPEAFISFRWREEHAGRQLKVGDLVAGSPPGGSGGTYRALRSDIPVVLNYLRQKGLPNELALQVLDEADYIPQRRLPARGDPLHLENFGELRKYLTYCWRLLLWCDILAKACGREVDWVHEVTWCIMDLWGLENTKARILRWHPEEHNAPNYLDTLFYQRYVFE